VKFHYCCSFVRMDDHVYSYSGYWSGKAGQVQSLLLLGDIRQPSRNKAFTSIRVTQLGTSLPIRIPSFFAQFDNQDWIDGLRSKPWTHSFCRVLASSTVTFLCLPGLQTLVAPMHACHAGRNRLGQTSLICHECCS